LESHPQEIARTLLSVQRGAPERLWARARDAQSVGNRGFAILRADTPDGPWRALTRVAYFGGFVIDAEGVISVGDELGGVARSSDDGVSFKQLNAEVSVACLAQAGSGLWAGTIGVLREPALQTMAGAQPFAGVVALAEIEQLVSCSPELQVEHVCAGAWSEWQRDVLMRPFAAPDAGVLPVEPDGGVAEPDAEIAGEDAGDPSTPARRADSSGCAVVGVGTRERRTDSGPWNAALFTLTLCARRRRR
jgi:hypothetical protein